MVFCFLTQINVDSKYTQHDENDIHNMIENTVPVT